MAIVKCSDSTCKYNKECICQKETLVMSKGFSSSSVAEPYNYQYSCYQKNKDIPYNKYKYFED